jgi:hypothetical protein
VIDLAGFGFDCQSLEVKASIGGRLSSSVRVSLVPAAFAVPKDIKMPKLKHLIVHIN